jgi:hypothetical protein
MNYRFKKLYFLVLILIITITLTSFSKNSEQNIVEIPITTWLKIGPIESNLPVFHEIKNIRGKEFDLKSLLQFEQFEIKDLLPGKGETFPWDQTRTFKWIKAEADFQGFIFEAASEKTLPQFMYFISYIDAKRWTKAKLEMLSNHLFQVYLDGEKLTDKTSSEKPKDDTTYAEPGKATQKLKLETGKHQLLVKSLRDPDNESKWNLKAVLYLNEPWSEGDLSVNISPTHHMTIHHLLGGSKIGNVSISPDGEIVALSIRQSMPPGDDSESWIELRRVNDGSLLNTYRGGMKLSYVQWAPIGNKFSYTSSSKDGSTLCIVYLDKGTSTPLL